MTKIAEHVITALQQIVGEKGVKTDSESLITYGKDWTKQYLPKPSAIVFPSSTEQVQQLVQLANREQLAIVPSGGRTGLSGGAVATGGEIVVALDKMNTLQNFNGIDRTVQCGAGVITEQLQQFAEEQDLFYPVDFASSGSSQIGGNISTNAGGIKVIRYGMTRDWVAGLTVVTGKGDVLTVNKDLVKNATGYDFRHLFIGAEGTLGIVTEATIRLARPPKDLTVLVLGVENFANIMDVLTTFQGALDLTAFEFFSDKAANHVVAQGHVQKPFASPCQFYALLEFENNAADQLETAMQLFEQCVENGWVLDGVMSQSAGQAANLWRLREDISESIAPRTPYKNDISVRVSDVPAFLTAVDDVVTQHYPDFDIIWFGHIGDGNVHLNILKPESWSQESFFEKCHQVSQWVFEIVERFQGSVSAEHGVGLLKRDYLSYTRSQEELDYMRALKAVFDPNNIMNPGKMLP